MTPVSRDSMRTKAKEAEGAGQAVQAAGFERQAEAFEEGKQAARAAEEPKRTR